MDLGLELGGQTIVGTPTLDFSRSCSAHVGGPLTHAMVLGVKSPRSLCTQSRRDLGCDCSQDVLGAVLEVVVEALDDDKRHHDGQDSGLDGAVAVKHAVSHGAAQSDQVLQVGTCDFLLHGLGRAVHLGCQVP